MTIRAAGVDLGGMFTQPFVQHAFLAGTAIAAAAGLVGYFLVLRAQVFTTDALGHVAYTGALGALAFGAAARAGLYVATILVAVGLAGLGRRAKADDVVIGSTFAWVLGLGSLFLTLYTTNRSTADATASVTYLFGSIYGLSAGDATTAALIAAAVCAVLLLIARPLLFASIDDSVAAARGVPVRLLGAGFLLLVGVTAAEATRAVGGLLILGLVAAPAGAAHRLTTRPFRGVALSVVIAVSSMWAGLVVSYAVPRLPPSFAILAVATGVYLCVGVATGARRRRSVGRSQAKWMTLTTPATRQ
jgi:zinc/manganese transport system permease protein